MRIAALYDIHGNLPALEAVIADVRRAGVDRVLVGGDVLPGPMPRETLDLLLGLEIPTDFIRGNGESEVLTQLAGNELVRVPEQFRSGVEWAAGQLDERHQRAIREWPMSLVLGEVMFCHATPRSDVDIFTRVTPENRLLEVFGECPPTVVCGHTHMQFDRTIGGVRVVNAGSVGMPYGDPGAYWLVLGNGVELRRTEYDLASAAERVRETSHPFAEDFAANSVLAPASEARMTEMFERFAQGSNR